MLQKGQTRAEGTLCLIFGEKEARIALKGVRIDLEHEACVLEDSIWLDDFHSKFLYFWNLLEFMDFFFN